MLVRFYFNIKKDDNKSDEEWHQFLKSTLMSPGREFSLRLTWEDHVRFLEYYHGEAN